MGDGVLVFLSGMVDGRLPSHSDNRPTEIFKKLLVNYKKSEPPSIGTSLCVFLFVFLFVFLYVFLCVCLCLLFCIFFHF